MHRQLLAEFGCVVDIDLYQLETACHIRGDLLEGRADHPAGRAPGRPQGDDHGNGGALRDLSEVVVGRVHDPGERRAAVATARAALGGGGHAVLPAAACTPNTWGGHPWAAF